MERRLRPEVVEASAEVLDEGMPGDDDPGGAISLQPPHGPESSLEASVVGLDGIVGGCRRDLIAPVSVTEARTTNATVAVKGDDVTC